MDNAMVHDIITRVLIDPKIYLQISDNWYVFMLNHIINVPIYTERYMGLILNEEHVAKLPEEIWQELFKKFIIEKNESMMKLFLESKTVQQRLPIEKMKELIHEFSISRNLQEKGWPEPFAQVGGYFGMKVKTGLEKVEKMIQGFDRKGPRIENSYRPMMMPKVPKAPRTRLGRPSIPKIPKLAMNPRLAMAHF